MLDWIESYSVDLNSFAMSVLLLIAYHRYIAYRIRKNPTFTVQAVNRLARKAWVETIMRQPGREILAVQTLRNSTMAATFLASTAVLFIIGVLSLSGQGDKLEGTWHVLNFGSKHSELWLIKLLLLLLDLFAAFFSFAMAVRVFNHVGYLVNVPLELDYKMICPAHVAVHLNRAGKFYSLGMRAFYFTVPLVFWLFGPHLMVAATLGLVIVLYYLDRAPRVLVADDRGNYPEDVS